MSTTSQNPGNQPETISAEKFDEKFEAGEDIGAHLDFSKAVLVPPSVGLEPADVAPQKVNVDFPAWVVSALDREATRRGVARQALIKMWIVEKLEAA
jgi:hypothetical protein